ncbi:MAG TPA: FtsX-like permease family protein, partial [Gemmatimonadota bacterium]|nr:FtsX-like permease family protein [Gemmatimonadota bacterium]
LLLGAILVLIICSVNVGALILLRGMSRSREVALRTALGAKRARLARQLLTEILVLTLLGGGAGVAVAHWGLPVVLRALDLTLPAFAPISVNGRVFLVSLLSVAAVGLLLGLYPALRGSRADPGLLLRSRSGSGHGGSRRTGQLLVAAEVGLAVVLLVGAGLTAKSLHRLADTGVGYAPEGLLTLRLDLTGAVPEEVHPEFVRLLLDEVRALPEVGNATVWGPSMLGRAHWHVGVSPPGTDPSDPDHRVLAQRLLVAPAGLEMLGVEPVRGRTFTETDRGSEGWPVVIDRRLAEAFWPGEDPVGRRLPMSASSLGPAGAVVIGVVEEVRHRGRLTRQEGVVGDVYFLYDDRPWPTVSLLVRPRGGEAAMSGVADRVRETVGRLNASVPIFDLAPMTDRLRREEATPRFTATLMSIYAVVAILLALVGTYGVLAYTLRQRTREMAVRAALGARKSDIVWMVFRQGLGTVVAGVIGGAIVALTSASLIESLLFQVSTADRHVFTIVILLVTATATLASFLPARRAAALEPMRILREE